MSAQAPRVLLVVPDAGTRAALRGQLPLEWQVREADGVAAAMARLEEGATDVVLTDLPRPTAFVTAVRARQPAPWVIVVADLVDGEELRALRRSGLALTLPRPSEPGDLRAWAEHGVSMARLATTTTKPPIERRRTERRRSGSSLSSSAISIPTPPPHTSLAPPPRPAPTTPTSTPAPTPTAADGTAPPGGAPPSG